MASWFKDAIYFGERARLLGHKIKHAITNHYICDVLTNRKVFNIAVPEFDIVIAKLFSIRPRFLDHLLGKIDAYDFSAGSCGRSRDEGVIARAGAKINDDITFPDLSKLRR